MTFYRIMDYICVAGSCIACVAWVAYGFDWITVEPTGRNAGVMAIGFYFQARYFYLQAKADAR